MALPHTLGTRIAWLLWFVTTAAAFLVGILAFAAGSAPHVVMQGQLLQIDVRNVSHAAVTKIIEPRMFNHLNTTNLSKLAYDDYKDHEMLATTIPSKALPTSPQPPSDVGFYNVYLWNYCVGKYKPQSHDDQVQGGAFKFAYGVTWCSPRNMIWGYNTISTVQAALPEYIRPEYEPKTWRFNAIWVLYLIGLVPGGLIVLCAIVMQAARFEFLEMVMFFLFPISFLGMLGGSIGATALLTEAAKQWNDINPDSGVVAYDGGLFLALTWSSTAIYPFLMGIEYITGVRNKIQATSKVDVWEGQEDMEMAHLRDQQPFEKHFYPPPAA